MQLKSNYDSRKNGDGGLDFIDEDERDDKYNDENEHKLK